MYSSKKIFHSSAYKYQYSCIYCVGEFRWLVVWRVLAKCSKTTEKTTENLSACSLCAEKTVSKWHQAAKYDIEIWHYCPVSPLSVLCTWFYPWFHINLKGKWIRVQEAASNICAQNILWHRLCISLSVSNSMKVTRRRRRGFIRIVKGRDEFTDADEEVHIFFTFGEHKSTESCMLVFACIWRKRNAKHGAWLFLKSSS